MMMKNKSLIKPFSTRKKSDKEAAILGKAILKKKHNAIVLYRRKKWDLVELLEHLAQRIHKLERNQCKPSAKCLFEGQEYLDKKYIGTTQ